MKYILTILFGEKIKGEKVLPPSFRTTHPSIQLSETEWYSELRPASQYFQPAKYYSQNSWRSEIKSLSLGTIK